MSDARHIKIGRNLQGHWIDLQRILDAAITVAYLFLLLVHSEIPVDLGMAYFLSLSFLLIMMIFSSVGLYRHWGVERITLSKFGLILIAWLEVFFVLYILLSIHAPTIKTMDLVLMLIGPPLFVPMSHRIVSATISFINGRNYESVVILGATKVGLEIAKKFKVGKTLGFRFLGFFDDRNRKRLKLPSNEILLGRFFQVPDFIRAANIHLVFITLPMKDEPRIVKIVEELSDTTASICFVPDLFNFDLMQGSIWDLGGTPIVTIRDTPFRGVRGMMKTLIDYVIAATLLIVLLPLMAMIAMGVKLTSPGPVIFRQRRNGLWGQEFEIYKFRTMYHKEGEDLGEMQVTRDDPRVTKFGHLLRRTSLDELPQLINVLEGKLSLVGPRPHALVQNETYRKLIKGYMLRHKVKPGITGWAQVSGLRGEKTLEDMELRVRYDEYYLRNWSLGFDLLIILKTPFEMLRMRNAY